MRDIEIIPNTSVGHIKIGDSVNRYLNDKYVYFKKDINDEYMEDYYEFLDPPLIVFVNKSNRITTINCKVRCVWKDKNLIGLSLGEFIELSGKEPDSNEEIYVLLAYNKGQKQSVYSFEELGMQIWTWKNKIVTVSCTNYDI